ncbi:MAG: hypothetical protein HOV80_09170 [Polyangiaceae bacterium]|nr:hypothetical protein [Polyangiaceae bacterium]
MPPTDASDSAQATPTASDAQDGDVRAAIDTFLADPANGDPQKIMRFANESPDVLVVFRQSILEAEGAPGDLRALMLAAFAAGNVRSQLEAGKKEDMPVAGVRAMVAVYKKLQANKPDLRVDLYETYAAKESDGTLEAFVTERAKKE